MSDRIKPDRTAAYLWYVSNKMSEHMQDRMSNKLSEYMSDRMPTEDKRAK